MSSEVVVECVQGSSLHLHWREETEQLAISDELAGFAAAILWVAERARTQGEPLSARLVFPLRTWHVEVDPSGTYTVLDHAAAPQVAPAGGDIDIQEYLDPASQPTPRRVTGLEAGPSPAPVEAADPVAVPAPAQSAPSWPKRWPVALLVGSALVIVAGTALTLPRGSQAQTTTDLPTPTTLATTTDGAMTVTPAPTFTETPTLTPSAPVPVSTEPTVAAAASTVPSTTRPTRTAAVTTKAPAAPAPAPKATTAGPVAVAMKPTITSFSCSRSGNTFSASATFHMNGSGGSATFVVGPVTLPKAVPANTGWAQVKATISPSPQMCSVTVTNAAGSATTDPISTT